MAYLPSWLCSILTQSKALEDKFIQKSTVNEANVVIQPTEDFSPLFSNKIIAHSAELENAEVIEDVAYEVAWKEIFKHKDNLIIGQQEYGRQHKKRFLELINAVLLLTQTKDTPKVIEFGVSEFSALYKHFKPGIVLHTVDRPTDEDYIGFTRKVCENVSGCAKHFEIDLNNPKSIYSQFEKDKGSYDLILFTEILEHLIVNPVELLRALLDLLNTQGSLYLTTPNFYSKKNLDLIAARQNPQAVYPEEDGNWDAHHHFREYCAKELRTMIEQARGKTTHFYFSNCWSDKNDAALPIDQRENLVFVVQRAFKPVDP